jgi:hypothetical protein
MTMQDRIDDAEVLWSANRREGALTMALVAVNTAAKEAHPELQHGPAFKRFLSERQSAVVELKYRRRMTTFESLLWHFLRCELIHTSSLPVDIQFLSGGDPPSDFHIRVNGPPDFSVHISEGWYWWLLRLVEEWLDGTSDHQGPNSVVTLGSSGSVTYAIGTPENRSSMGRATKDT